MERLSLSSGVNNAMLASLDFGLFANQQASTAGNRTGRLYDYEQCCALPKNGCGDSTVTEAKKTILLIWDGAGLCSGWLTAMV